MQKQTELDIKLFEWLERNAPWLMKLKSEDVMWRVGLELNHGKLLGRSYDESLIVAASILRQAYEDGQGYQTSDSQSGTPEKDSDQEEDDDDGE